MVGLEGIGIICLRALIMWFLFLLLQWHCDALAYAHEPLGVQTVQGVRKGRRRVRERTGVQERTQEGHAGAKGRG